MDELRDELRKYNYRVESYADFVSVGIVDGVKVNLLADGGSELELGFESHRDLSADETKALADVLRIFEEWRQE